jgi:predicted cupin superfamily sugar epimerase
LKSADYWIEKFNMLPHPEGGFFKEVYRSEESIKCENLPGRYNGDRNFSTSIYFLLKEDNFSSFHRLKSDEIWHFYSGSLVRIYIISDEGKLDIIDLGEEIFQYAIKAGNWFAAEVIEKDSFSLVGCTVSPGFHFDDFEIGIKDNLLTKFPQHAELIVRMTR